MRPGSVGAGERPAGGIQAGWKHMAPGHSQLQAARPQGGLPTLSCLCLHTGCPSTFQTLGLGSEAEKTGSSEKGQESNPTTAALWGLELSQQTGQDFTSSWSPPTDFQPPALPLRPAKHQASLRKSHLCPLWPLPTSAILPKANRPLSSRSF